VFRTGPPGCVAVRRDSGLGLLPRQLEQGSRVATGQRQLIEVPPAGSIRLGV
jgi:hypothetical protein